MTLKELSKYGFNTLEEILKIINDNKIILIELKEFGNDYINLVNETIKVINKYFSLNIFVSSFNYLLVNYLKNNYPNIKCGVIVGYGLNSTKVINNFDFNEVSYNYLKLINNKKTLFVFGVNNKNIKLLPISSYIITNDSYKLKDML